MSPELESYITYCEEAKIIPTIPSFLSFAMENEFEATKKDLKWLAAYSEGKLADFALSNKSSPNMKIAFLQKYLDKYCGYRNENKPDVQVPVNISLGGELGKQVPDANLENRETGKKEFFDLLEDYVKTEAPTNNGTNKN